MLRSSLLCSMLFLTACGHYQGLKQENNTSQADNRYSQDGIIINEKKKTVPVKKPVIIAKKTTASQLGNNKTKISKSEIKNKQTSLWSQFINIFTPEKVKPWQKATLAKATMKPGGLTPTTEKFNQKIYSSKESSRGGLGVAGGGCGCN